MTKRIFSLIFMAFAAMHLLAVIIFLARFHTVKIQSLILGAGFLALGIWLYNESK